MSHDQSDHPPKHIDDTHTKLISRVEFAAKRGTEFSTEVRKWGNDHPVSLTGEIADDRLSYKIVLNFSQQPSLDDWGRTFGDAMHNLRSVLNNMVAEIAQAEGATKEQIKSVQFPVALSAKQWRSEKKRIQLLPPEVRTAIEKVQPFTEMPQSPEQHPLAVLSALSNQDKHRLELTPAIEPQQLSHNASIEFEEVPNPSVLQQVMNRMVIDGRFQDGVEVIAHDTTPYRVARLIGYHQYHGRVQVVTDEGVTLSPAEVMNTVFPAVTSVIDGVLYAWANKAEPPTESG
jgi:hypothetical protein